VAEATEGADPELVIAALLHDAIEDQGVTAVEIERTWGKRVADLVLEVTDDKSLPKPFASRSRRRVQGGNHREQRSSSSRIRRATFEPSLRPLQQAGQPSDGPTTSPGRSA
jgi:(p)ppGpp synthase/HD superfamily hydrolase